MRSTLCWRGEGRDGGRGAGAGCEETDGREDEKERECTEREVWKREELNKGLNGIGECKGEEEGTKGMG